MSEHNPNSLNRFLAAVRKERTRQLEKWGVQRCRWNGPDDATNYASDAQVYKILNDSREQKGMPGYWDAILLEEVFEALEAIELGDFDAARKELDEIAAVCASMYEQIDEEHPPEVAKERPVCGATFSSFEEVRGVKLNMGIKRCALLRHTPEVEHSWRV